MARCLVCGRRANCVRRNLSTASPAARGIWLGNGLRLSAWSRKPGQPLRVDLSRWRLAVRHALGCAGRPRSTPLSDPLVTRCSTDHQARTMAGHLIGRGQRSSAEEFQTRCVWYGRTNPPPTVNKVSTTFSPTLPNPFPRLSPGGCALMDEQSCGGASAPGLKHHATANDRSHFAGRSAANQDRHRAERHHS